MPVIVYNTGVHTSPIYIVPAPLVSFDKQVYNNVGRPGFGADYTITLQGTIIPTHGNPVYLEAASGGSGEADFFAGGNGAWQTTSEIEENTPEYTPLSGLQLLDATIAKQYMIRRVFTNPIVSGIAKPIKVQIKGWGEKGLTPGSGIVFYGFVDSITFDSDGQWAKPSTYTVVMRNSTFLNSPQSTAAFPSGWNEHFNKESGNYAISSFTENFDIQEDGRKTIVWGSGTGFRKAPQNFLKVYTVNRSIAAVGSPVYADDGSYKDGLSPWQQASGFIYDYLTISATGSDFYQQFTPYGSRILGGSGTGINNSGLWKAANFTYQETIDKEAGAYSLNESFIMYSGEHPVLENITVNTDISDNGTVTVNVQGTIEGLNTIAFEKSGDAFKNAYNYYKVVTSGTPVSAYMIARGAIQKEGNWDDRLNNQRVEWLHPKPLSHSVAQDFSAGSISYTYSFDNRPPNLIPGSVSESIQIQDTYPGELFSVTPVIGRSQPVLQYLNSRSEYKRSLSINVTMEPISPYLYSLGGTGQFVVNNSGLVPFAGANSSGGPRQLIQKLYIREKPSIVYTQELNEIFQAANPVNDPFFDVHRGKCYHSAPTENWDARTRNYSYSIEWTYERKPGSKFT